MRSLKLTLPGEKIQANELDDMQKIELGENLSTA